VPDALNESAISPHASPGRTGRLFLPRTACKIACTSGADDDVSAADGGAYLIADTAGNRIRRVDAGGTITPVAGSGTACATATALCGDAGPAALASVNAPRGVLDLPDGSTVLADSGTNRLRARVPDAPGPIGPHGPQGPAGAPGPAGSAGTPGATITAPSRVTVAFASVKLTSRAALTTTLRLVITRPAVVVVRISRSGKTVVARRVAYRSSGRKRISVGPLRAGTYAVTATATDGAATDVDRAKLRVLPGR
jgi:hypothetical protein